MFYCTLGTVICTALLVLFGLLQWKAIARQNDQNLFKMRLDCYARIESLIFGINEDLFFIKDLNKTLEHIEEFQLKLKQLIVMIPEIELLFPKNVHKKFSEFIDFMSENLKNITSICNDPLGDFSEDEKEYNFPEISLNIIKEMLDQYNKLSKLLKAEIKF